VKWGVVRLDPARRVVRSPTVNRTHRIARELTPTGSRVAAAVVASLIVALTAILLPVADRPLGELKPFVPMFATTVIITEYLTAYMLVTHFRVTREAFLAALGGASLFVCVMATAQLCIFPGVFTATGLFGAGPQSAVWVWVLWHGGYPTFVLLTLLLRLPALTRRREGGPRWLPSAGVAILVGSVLVAIACAWLAIADGGVLPPLIDGQSYSRLVQSPAAPVVVAINVGALLLCLYVTRLRDLLSAWLAVAILASLADVVLTLTASARFSLGWYAARCLSVVSSSVVLGVLVWQTSALYRQLTRMHEELAERSERDALTGAYNRGHFIDQFPRDLRRSLREREPLALLMVDIDYFKVYNDAFGHQKGDECLQAVAHAMQRALKRPADYLARYGGEEFVVVLPNTTAAGALFVAEAIRSEIATLRMPSPESNDRFVTVSIGVAAFNPELDDFRSEVLVRRADDALYQAKREGRDRVATFGDRPPEFVTAVTAY